MMALFNGSIHHSVHTLPPKPVFEHQSPASSISPVHVSSRPQDDSTLNCLNYSFCIPFTILPGPDPNDIILATAGAVDNWLHPPGSPQDAPPCKLPVHTRNVEMLKKLCKEISESPDYKCRAMVVVSEPKHASFRSRKQGVVTNVWLAGDSDIVVRVKGHILQSSPVALRTACVNIDRDQIYLDGERIRSWLPGHLEKIAEFTGTDIFVLKPPELSPDAAVDPGSDTSQRDRLQIKIYGDYESVEHAKTRILIMIDDLLGQTMDCTFLEVSMQTVICGRGRKNVKNIEALTRTAIYFPPQFPRIYGYKPPGVEPRQPDQIFITGRTREDIQKAERMLLNLSRITRLYVKDVMMTLTKIDYILLQRLDEVKKIMDTNGTHIQFPALGSSQTMIRVQGQETLHIERTVRGIMAICGQFYNASWWIIPDINTLNISKPPTAREIQQMLTDISAFSGADIAFNKQAFDICGPDDNVKLALHILNEVRFVNQSPYQIRVKIELANEHKEFVSGKKNGKINKIMGQSGIQIIFDGFNEYNFFIDVVGTHHDSTMVGLQLVEHELPASVSFHVPDSYHKRIIGIGGQHIQRIMKKYSVFVKFSNAMERGTAGRADNDDSKVDNVICRTPARNAKNLELVKSEIMDMVQQADAEIVEENVVVPRLLHRTLAAERQILDELESRWGCSIIFPSTETASDVVTIKGPEWQIPQAVNEFLALIPETHKIQLPRSPLFDRLISGPGIRREVIEPMRTQFGIDMHFEDDVKKENRLNTQTVHFTYTRNNAGGIRDAIEMLTRFLASHGAPAEPVKGALPRPKSDSFEDYVPFFNAAVLQKTDPFSVPGSRLSGDMTSVLTEQLHNEPGPLNNETEAAFYEGGRKASMAESEAGMSAPRSGSTTSSIARLSIGHGRSGSIASLAWENGVEATGLPDGEEWTKVEGRSRSGSLVNLH